MKSCRLMIITLVAIGLSSSYVFGAAEAVNRGLKITVKNSAGITNDVDLYSGYHALVIGIGNYRSPWSALPGAIEDAREVAETFQSIGWDTTLLENPTGTELKRSFNRLIAGPGRDSQKAILVWFSGHGHTLKQFDGTPSGYLVPSDAPDPELDEVGFRGTAMDMASIEQISKNILSKHVLMMFDSCFSGSLFTVSRSLKPSPYIQMKTLKPVRQFITAGQADEKVPDDSIFQKVFLQGLSDRYADLNRDGYVTGEELGAYLQENVINYSNSTQHPQYAKINHHLLDKGDFVFVLPNAELANVQDRRVQELELWVNIRDSDDPMFFKDFLQRFPDGMFAGLAKLRLNNLLEPKQVKKKESTAREQEKQEAYAALGRLAGAIKGKIEGSWSNRLACSGQEVTISVKVNISGDVTAAKVVGDSGDDACRRSAENAVYKASPLPFPDNPRFFKWLDQEFQIIFKPDI